jgi:hypothetical protein
MGCGPSEGFHPLLLLDPVEVSGPSGPVGPARVSSPGPRVLVSSAVARRGRYKRMWLPRGCLDPSLGFLVSSQEVWRRGPFRYLLRSPVPPPLSRSFAEVVAMSRRGDEGRGKRRLEGFGEEGGARTAVVRTVGAGTSQRARRGTRASKVAIRISGSQSSGFRSRSSGTTGTLRLLGGWRSRSVRRRPRPPRIAGLVMAKARVRQVEPGARVASRARRRRRRRRVRPRRRSRRGRASRGMARPC